jgi:hypothetical protein
MGIHRDRPALIGHDVEHGVDLPIGQMLEPRAGSGTEQDQAAALR